MIGRHFYFLVQKLNFIFIMFKYNLFLLFFLVGSLSFSQLPGDAFVLSTNRNLRGKTILRKESRSFKMMRKREKKIGRKSAARTAQKFITKKHIRKRKKVKERKPEYF
jgi:hypothetical protein